jgi:drug/metabolite transporter (DMT)-like permease
MVLSHKPKHWQILAILIIGILSVSSAAIFIRLCMKVTGMQGNIGFSLFLAASRLILASLFLVPTWKNLPNFRVVKQGYYYAAAAGCCLGLHFAFWISSLSLTSIAASTTIVTTNPMWVAIFSWLWFKERLTKLSMLGMGIAFLGAGAIALAEWGSITVGSNPLLGDLLALVGAWMASIYFLCGREAQRQGLSIGNYIAVAYTTAALLLLPFPNLFGSSYFGYSGLVYFYVLLMAVLSQLVGHTSFNWAVRWISPTFVTLGILFEPIGSSLLGFLFFDELPSPLVLVGGFLLLLGVATAVFNKAKK